MVRGVWVAVLAGLVLAGAAGRAQQDSPDKFPVRREIGLGVRAFRMGRYEEAAQHFEKAIQMDPESINPRLYLATSYASMYRPGATDAANLEWIQKAEGEYLKVLELNPDDDTALRSLAGLAYERAEGIRDPAEKREQLKRAAGWYEQAGESLPKDKGAFYMVGVIAWEECEPAIRTARLAAGRGPATQGMIPDAGARTKLRAECGETLEDGVRKLEHAVELDPGYAEAMNYLSLIERQEASFAATEAEAAGHVKAAEEWERKAAQARKHPAAPSAEP
jgi:tetratricopeptide (TPR) repeat protein